MTCVTVPSTSLCSTSTQNLDGESHHTACDTFMCAHKPTCATVQCIILHSNHIYATVQYTPLHCCTQPTHVTLHYKPSRQLHMVCDASDSPSLLVQLQVQCGGWSHCLCALLQLKTWTVSPTTLQVSADVHSCACHCPSCFLQHAVSSLLLQDPTSGC